MTIASIAMTRISSMSVKAPSSFLLPVGNVIFIPLASVGSDRVQVVAAGIVFARTNINVGMVPRVQGDVLFHIRSVPVLRVARLRAEVLKPVFALGIIPVVRLEDAQRGAEGADLRFRRALLRLLGPSGKFRHDDRRQNT